MLLESLSIYEDDLKPIIFKFSKSPKANFMASPDLVRFFHISNSEDETDFLENFIIGENFKYKNQAYLINEKSKKNYICTNLNTGKKYIFKPLSRVEKL